DALFLRNPETVGVGQDETQRCLMLHKLAFLAVTFQQVEMAAECLRLAEASPTVSAVRKDLAALEYGRFLSDFWTAVRRQPAFFPATFGSQFSFAASRSRFDTAGGRGLKWVEPVRVWWVRE